MGLIQALPRFLLLLGSAVALVLMRPELAEARDVKGANARAVSGVKVTQGARARPKSTLDAETEARLAKLGSLINEIGLEGAQIAGGKTDGLFLYAEMKDRQARLFLFRDRGKTVKRFVETPRLRELVEQAWALESAKARWAAMVIEVSGKKFDAHFIFPEEIDSRQSIDERVAALMPKRFDGKKLVADRKRPAEDESGGYEPDMDWTEPVDLDQSRRWT